MSERKRSRELKRELDRVTRNAQNFSLQSKQLTDDTSYSTEVSHKQRVHRTPPRPRGLRRVGSYDSLQQSINSTFSSDSIRRFKSSSFDLSPTHDTSLNRSFTFANNDRLKNAPKVTKAEASKYKLYPDYSRNRTSSWAQGGSTSQSKKKSGQSKNSKSKVLKKISSWDGENKTSSQLRKERQREQIEKKLKEKHGWKKTNMEQQYEVGLESQYVSPLSWSKAEATVERGETIVVNPVYYKSQACPPGPSAYERYIQCCAYQEATFETPSPVLSWLYLGDRHDARDRSTFEDLGINFVINATPDIANYFEGETINGRPMRYINVDLVDAEGVDIMCHFARTNRFLMKCKRLGGKALVHCRAGVSRSTSITCAFLMFNETWRLCDALDFCRKKRFIVDPNIDFRLQLALYEIFLFGKSTVKARLNWREWDSYRLRSLLNKPGVEVCYTASPPPCAIM
eukprot:g15379.t1